MMYLQEAARKSREARGETQGAPGPRPGQVDLTTMPVAEAEAFLKEAGLG